MSFDFSIVEFGFEFKPMHKTDKPTDLWLTVKSTDIRQCGTDGMNKQEREMA